MTDEPVHQERLEVSILISALMIWPDVRHVHVPASVPLESGPPSTTFLKSLARQSESLMLADVLVVP